ncbi:MAG: lysophospholipid acyltransferase family protein [Chloroflexi bacterium]|nr:lysophospholipid acyltransferase family protein [Chloroflexota bacterium]
MGDILSWGLKGVTTLIRRTPRSLLGAVADVTGDVTFYVWPRGHRNTIANMRQVLGPLATQKQVRRVARESFRQYMRLLEEFVILPSFKEEELMKVVHVQGIEEIYTALDKGHGAILASMHFGNWDLAGMYGSNLGLPVHGVAVSLNSKLLDRLMRRSRRRYTELIPMGFGIRRVFKALKQNELVGITIDILHGAEGVEVEFFGKKTRVPPGAAQLALRADCSLLPFYVRRLPGGCYEGAILPPIVSPQKDSEEKVRDMMERLVQVFEEPIRQNPEQWYMFFRMWPENEGALAQELANSGA